MQLLAKQLIPVAGILLAFSASQTPAYCQQQVGISVGRGVSITIGLPKVATTAGLPPCNLDSFVYQAGAQRDMIYGDEGTTSYPPLFGFTQASRINAGITGINDAGLTTGHGSKMPDAWGADEFIAPPNGEWNLSGANGGNSQYNNGAAGLDARDQQDAITAAANQSASAAAESALLPAAASSSNFGWDMFGQ